MYLTQVLTLVLCFRGYYSFVYKDSATVHPVVPFEPRSDAARMRKAMTVSGTDIQAIIDLLTRRLLEQRLVIASTFQNHYQKDLVSELQQKLSGEFEDSIVALKTPLPKLFAKDLHIAVVGLGTDTDTLIEILVTLPNDQIKKVSEAYVEIFETNLENDVANDISGNFKELMVGLIKGNRSESTDINYDQTAKDANDLYNAGEGKLGTDEMVFINLLVSRSYTHLRLIFEVYKKTFGKSLYDVIKSEFSGDKAKALLALVTHVTYSYQYFAEQLFSAVSGTGTNTKKLNRIIVSRSEIDLRAIQEIYSRIYQRTLRSMVHDDTSGDYRILLLELLGHETTHERSTF